MINIKNAEYDNKDGCSQVEIETEIGNFLGTAFLHPEDESIKSAYLGCEIAEYRAVISYFKEKLKRLNVEIKTLENLKLDFIKTYKENYHECELLEKRLKQKNELKIEYKRNMKSLRDLIDNKVENREIIIKKLENIKKRREEGQE